MREAPVSLLPMICLLAACSVSRAPQEAAPEKLVDLAVLAPDIRMEMRYATTDNFVGAVIDGYHARRCLLSRPAAEAVAAAQAELRAFGLSLVMYDCYRPQRAVDHFARWARDPADQSMRERYYPEEDKTRLFERGYIAARSGHSRASTVDLGLLDGNGNALDMGTGWDFMDPRSATEHAGIAPLARRNRLLLRALMEKHGFLNYSQEWWHFTLRDEPWPDRYLDSEVR